MTTPSRKPSRATVVTASIAIGVFAAGTGLGAAVSALSPPAEAEEVRLSTGTYLLDARTGTWAALSPEQGEAPVAAGDPGTATATDTRVCLALTPDGRVVNGGGEGCTTLSSVGIALAAAQRPGNPSSDPAPPEKPADPPKSSESKPRDSGSSGTSGGNSGSQQTAPRRQNVAPPAQNAPQNRSGNSDPAPAPKPTKQISNNLGEGSRIVQPPASKQAVEVPAKEPSGRTFPSPRGTMNPHGNGAPADDRRSTPPDGTNGRTDDRRSTPPDGRTGDRTKKPRSTPAENRRSADKPAETGKATHPAEQPTRTANPEPPAEKGENAPPSVRTLKPARPSRGAQSPPDRRNTENSPDRRNTGTSPAPQHTQTAAPEDGRENPENQAPVPGETRAPSAQAPGGSGNPDTQAPDGSGNRDGDAPPPAGQNSPDVGVSLPVFRDPELLRRAQEALGLDRNMRYTDANGVWDLNIAPPGTPPCRNYSAAELAELRSSQGRTALPENAVPRDSCRWPAFLRWLFADPAPGEVSNWTKFTGLSEQSLELVVTDPPPAQSGIPQTDRNGQTGQNEQSEQTGQNEQGDQTDPFLQPAQPEGRSGGQEQPAPSGQSDPGGLDSVPPAQPGYGDPGGYGDSGGYGDPGYGQPAPDPAGYAGP
ncbi:hypothetical protein [Planomonospora sp. ID82291]|uniref:hypothetical protein n=1 Tax=Planomonospora sp. ID82291 TaxID=2738136 RepID=UPI0018C39F65|nr:hypothetical protein [Planomonospora sp. ID82291]MBG0814459.1 hypothetical protein [Planomonospora sp. ID82291]